MVLHIHDVCHVVCMYVCTSSSSYMYVLCSSSSSSISISTVEGRAAITAIYLFTQFTLTHFLLKFLIHSRQ